VRNKHFSTTRLRPGYDEGEVDAVLDELEAELDQLIQENEELRTGLAGLLRSRQVPHSRLLEHRRPRWVPGYVRGRQFSTTRLRPGYDEGEVDAFLDELEVELGRLTQENEEFRTKLIEVLGSENSGSAVVVAPSAPRLGPPRPQAGERHPGR
jgi:DivIVA domain-containing protein